MSSKAHPSDAIDPLDRMIARLYRSGLQVAAPQFRSWALAQLAQVLPCDGVLWGSGVLAEMRFHNVTVQDRKRVVEGKSVAVRVDIGGRRILTKKNHTE